MPGGRDECPVEARIEDLRRFDDRGQSLQYDEFNRHYNDNERAINTYCRIRPVRDDRFGLYLALYGDFDFKGYTHVKVSLFVDGWYVRTQYLEAPYDEWTLNVTKGRKFDRATGQTVEFNMLVGDVGNPGDHELDGTISVELSLGRKITRRRRVPRANLVEETESFRHGPSERVSSPRASRRMFISAPREHFTPMRWYFLYAEKVYRSDNTRPSPRSFVGLGKRPRSPGQEDGGGNFKHTRTDGGPDLYVEVPAYGSSRM